MKKNRTISFIIVFCVYALATALGILTYLNLPYAPWLNLLIADVVATALTFIFSLIFKNSSVYDPYWSVQPPIIVLGFALFNKATVFKIVLIAVIFLWAIRLTANWAYTFKNLTCQDWRYTMLKENTKALYPIVNFLGIHLFPTLVVYACTLPAVEVILLSTKVYWWAYLPLLLSILGILLQLISDIQMQKFRNNKNGQTFIRVGLWKYSRHPNYLGEILMWWGVAISSVLALSGHYYLLVGALVNNLMFVFISVPMADKRQAKKIGFSEYKKQTRIFLPIKK